MLKFQCRLEREGDTKDEAVHGTDCCPGPERRRTKSLRCYKRTVLATSQLVLEMTDQDKHEKENGGGGGGMGGFLVPWDSLREKINTSYCNRGRKPR